MLARNPKLTPSQVKDYMQKGCDDLTGDPTEDKVGFDNYFGWGRINAKKTLGLIPTSLGDLADESSKLEVFPNPSTGIFTVSSAEILLHGSSYEKGGTLEVFTMTGQSILSKSLQNNENQLVMNIDLSAQPNGVYFIHFKNEKAFMSKKVIKQ